MKPALRVIRDHAFAARDFVGGDAALDFVNTVSGRDVAGRDRLDGYPRLLEWAAMAKLLPDKLIRALARQAQADPAAAAKALARAKSLREALFAIGEAIATGGSPPKAALDQLRTQWLAGAKAQALVARGGQVFVELDESALSLDLVAALVARRFVEGVLPVPPDRLRVCKGHDCAWLFIDRSKAGRRRWCDMAVCGNRAKARRFAAQAPGAA